MTDPTLQQPQYLDLLGSLLGVGANIYGATQASGASNTAANQLSQGYANAGNFIQGAANQAGNYITGAQNQMSGYAQPYMNLGTSSIPQYQQTAQAVGQQMTMPEFQASPWSQVANSAQKQQDDVIRAQSATQGMYGSGNMANALQQNAMNTQLGYYDKAQAAQLQNQQAANTAMFQPVSLGQNAAMNLGNQTANTARSMADLATGAGGSMANLAQAQSATQAANTLGQSKIGSNLISLLTNPAIYKALSPAIKALADKVLGGGGTKQEQLALQNALQNNTADMTEQSLPSIGGDTLQAPSYDTIQYA